MKKILIKILASYIILILIYIVQSTVVIIKYDIEEAKIINERIIK